MKYILFTILLFSFSIGQLCAQQLEKIIENDTIQDIFPTEKNMNAEFSRPALFRLEGKNSSFKFGGFTSASSQYFITDGEGVGLNFTLNNFNIFTESSFHNNRIKLNTNIGYDNISNNFRIYEAALNLEFAPFFNLKGGVLLPPIGNFNKYGDSPNRVIMDAPLVSTSIIPSTYSDIGFGISGKFGEDETIGLTYEVIAINGLQNGITDNGVPKTSIPLGRPESVLSPDNNDQLAVVGRLGISHKDIGQIGLSYYTGQYNTTEVDETEIDDPRNLSLMTLDAKFDLLGLKIEGEAVWAKIDVYEGLDQIFGNEQMGYYIEASYPIIKRVKLLGNNQNSFNIAFRYEFADYNVGNFKQTDSNIFDQTQGFKIGTGLSLGKKTVLNANYTFLNNKDILGNESKTGGFQFGFATYF